MTSLAAARVVEFDPLKDKRYRRATLARDVVDWLDPSRYTHTDVRDVAEHMALIEAGEA